MTPTQRDSAGLAHAVADATATAWHSTYGTGRTDVPITVVATLALTRRESGKATEMQAWNPQEFHARIRWIWSTVISHRPELSVALFPLIGWVFDEPDVELQSHACQVMRAALRAGQLELTGTDCRYEVDLLGTALTVLRPASALKQRGQFYTPTDVSVLMAQMSCPLEVSDVHDPTMGTGGLFRATAEVLRARGRDPRTVQWVGCDIDPLAVACATVNSIVWDLGVNVLFYIGDALTGEAETVARKQRDELLTIAATVKRCKELFVLLDIRRP